MDKVGQLNKVKQSCRRISLLMEHQEILPDLREIAMELYPGVADTEYMQGAQDALTYLILYLEQKGSPKNRE